jgi:hypothetical protein
MDLHDVIDRLIERRGPTSEGEAQEMHDAVEADRQGLEGGSEAVARRRAATADATLAGEFEGVSEQELTERAADGDLRAQAERQRRKAEASTKEPVAV